jgi:hypothetical protein
MQEKLLAGLSFSENCLRVNDFCRALLSEAKTTGQSLKGAVYGVLITVSPLDNLEDLTNYFWAEVAAKEKHVRSFLADDAATLAVSKYPPD